MTSGGDDADATLVRLVSIALEQRAQGQEPSLDVICAERRDLLPAVADAIGLAASLPEVTWASPDLHAPRGRLFGGRYRCESVLGAGSMGVVYRATDLELQRTVAVKVLRVEVLPGEDSVARFARESQSLAAIHHRAVVTIHDRGHTEEGAPFFVMELLEGAPLNLVIEQAAAAAADGSFDRLDRFDWLGTMFDGPLPTSRASYLRIVVGWIAELAAGLHAAHEVGVLHRDVKPSNAFVRRNGLPVLLDFGIAARLDDGTAGDGTRTLGTAAYLAPEQLERVGPSVRADVYGLTATLYHLLTLQMPYSGTPSQILTQLHRADPPLARSLRPDLPRDLQAILDCGMARDPAARYPTAAALAADLQAFLDHRPIVARPTTRLGRLWRRTRRSPAVRGGAAVAVLAVLGLGAGLAWREHRTARQAQWLATWARLPPLLTWWNVRELTGERYAAARDLLDRAAATCVAAAPTRVVRAAFRLDHGDRAGADADMAAVAADIGSPLAVELARRYHAVASAAGANAAIAVDALPAADDEQDRYLLAFHQYRAGDLAAARATLAVPSTGEFAPVDELRLALGIELVRKQDTRSEGLDLARSIYLDAVRLETRIGRRTATTAHLIAGALISEQRYADAKPVLREGVALSTPGYHGLYSNLAIVERRTGDLDAAIEHCHLALAVNPRSGAAHETLVVTLADRADLDGARAALREAKVDQATRAGLEARVAYLEAYVAWQRGDRAAAKTFAERAVAMSGQALDRREARHELAFCNALVASSDVFTATLGAASEDVDDAWILRSLVLPAMPSELDAEQTTQVRRFLEALCRRSLPEPR